MKIEGNADKPSFFFFLLLFFLLFSKVSVPGVVKTRECFERGFRNKFICFTMQCCQSTLLQYEDFQYLTIERSHFGGKKREILLSEASSVDMLKYVE